MKTIKFLSLAFLSITAAISCKKHSSSNDVSSVKQDTLGTGWSKIQIDQRTLLDYGGDVFFKNNSVGYMCDNISTVFKSTNGGTSWTGIAQVKACNIAVTDDDKAFFVEGNLNTVYRTIDGGATFTTQAIGGNGAKAIDIFFADNNTGLCVTTNGLYKTIDGGITWTNACPLSNFTGPNAGVSMYDNQHAYIAYGNKVLHSNGDLINWHVDSILSPISTPLTLTGAYATSASTLYVSSLSGYVYKSMDGGFTFTLLKKLDNIYHKVYSTDMHFVDANTGYISLGSRIYKTTDAGNSWSVSVALGNADIYEIHFSDATHGWALCNDNNLLILH